jgi:putative addiction module component (TIGR02574 family)
MNPTTERVLGAALALPDSERLELVEALIVSLQSSEDEPPLDDAWREVIAQRASEIEVGSVELTPWSEVKRRARNAPGG